MEKKNETPKTPEAEAEAAMREFEFARSLLEEAFSKAENALQACTSLVKTATRDPDFERRNAAGAALLGIVARCCAFPPSLAKKDAKAATLRTRSGAKARPA